MNIEIVNGDWREENLSVVSDVPGHEPYEPKVGEVVKVGNDEYLVGHVNRNLGQCDCCNVQYSGKIQVRTLFRVVESE